MGVPLFVVSRLRLASGLTKRVVNVTTNLRVPVVLVTNCCVGHVNGQLLVLVTVIDKVYFCTDMLVTAAPTIRLRLRVLGTVFLNVLYNVNVLCFRSLVPRGVNSTAASCTGASHIN